MTETKIQILCDHVDHTRFRIVEMGCQMVQLLSAHIAGPTMLVNLTPAKACLHTSRKDHSHMVANTFFKLSKVRLGLHTVVMIAGIHILQEIFANNIVTTLKPSLEHDRKYVLRLLRLYGDQALHN